MSGKDGLGGRGGTIAKEIKFLLLGVIVLLSVIPFVSAELSVSPTSYDITTLLDKSKEHSITFYNGFNYSIYNVTFSPINGFNFPTVTEIPSNQSKTVNFTTLFTDIIDTQETSTVSFVYFVSVDPTIHIHDVNITDAGFMPGEITILRQDKVRWNNTGSIAHTVTTVTGEPVLEHTLLPNETYEVGFDFVNRMEYKDDVLFFGGAVNVLERYSDEPTHNPIYDKTISFNLRSVYEETYLVLQLLENNYTVEFGKSTEGILSIKNNGSLDAYNIELSSSLPSWIAFEENNFNLSIGETNFITYTVVPDLQYTNETDKQYDIGISVVSDNAETITDFLYVMVPFKDIENQSQENLSEFFKQKLEFCNNFPTSPYCLQEPLIEYVNITIYREAPLPYNFTFEEIRTIFTRLQTLEDLNTRTTNNIKETMDLIRTDLQDMRQNVNSSTAIAMEAKKKADDEQRARWMVIIGVIIVATIGFATFVLIMRRRQMQKEDIVGVENI